jgi:hypothetical protein
MQNLTRWNPIRDILTLREAMDQLARIGSPENRGWRSHEPMHCSMQPEARASL